MIALDLINQIAEENPHFTEEQIAEAFEATAKKNHRLSAALIMEAFADLEAKKTFRARTSLMTCLKPIWPSTQN